MSGKRKNLKSVRVHFLQMQLLFLIVLVGGFSLLYFLFADTFYFHQKSKLMKKSFEALKQMDLSAGEELESFFSEYEDANFRFKIVDEHNLSVYCTGITLKKLDMESDKKVGWEERYQEIPSLEYRGRQIYLRGRILQNEHIYYVRITENTKSAGNSFAYTEAFLVLLLGVVVVAGIVMMWFMTDRMLRSVENINQVANHISRRDFSRKADETVRYRELRELAESVNRMSEEIQDSLIYLEETNHILLEENRYKEKLNRMRQEFLGNISHELKTPLAIMANHVELLQCMEEKIDKEYYYNSLMDEIKSMTDMVENLLELSSVEQGLENMDRKAMDLSVSVNRLIGKSEILAQKKQASLKVDCEEGCVVLGNERYLSQAVGNYLTNAVKHVREGGEIRLTLSQAEGDALCTVYNDGENIEERDLEKIWKSSVVLEEEGDEDDDGIMSNTGLGLYLVRKIVTLHHGSCGVENQAQGVLFWLRIPLISEEDEKTE